MKKILSLLLLIPLATIAAEHGNKSMQKKAHTQLAQVSEHGGKAMKTKKQAGEAAEHGGKAMESKEQAGKTAEHAGTAAEHAGQELNKKADGKAGASAQ